MSQILHFHSTSIPIQTIAKALFCSISSIIFHQVFLRQGFNRIFIGLGDINLYCGFDLDPRFGVLNRKERMLWVRA